MQVKGGMSLCHEEVREIRGGRAPANNKSPTRSQSNSIALRQQNTFEGADISSACCERGRLEALRKLAFPF